MSDKLTIKNNADFFKALKEHDIQFIDFNFTDLRGKWQHTAQHIETVDKELIEDGLYFDGSSIAGWQHINESDMILKPDVALRRAVARIEVLQADRHVLRQPQLEVAEPVAPERAAEAADGERPKEYGGRDGLDPTRYGDWEKNGRCIDF